MDPIKITNVGPIKAAELPVPEEGGIVVLRGPNGAGKYHALRALEALLDGNSEKPPTRDGAGAGMVEGFGAMLVLGKRRSQDGTVSVEGLVGHDPSKLVDPGIKDIAAADKGRIAALCRLAKVEADVDLFRALANGVELPSRVGSEADLPGMAGAAKREFEKLARDAEKKAEARLTEAATLRATAGEKPNSIGWRWEIVTSKPASWSSTPSWPAVIRAPTIRIRPVAPPSRSRASS